MGGVRNDAHLRPPEVVFKQVLEPHAGDKEEVPRVAAALQSVLISPFGARVAVLLFRLLIAGQGERLVKLLQQIDQRQAGRRLEGLVVLEQRQAHHDVGKPFDPARVGDLPHVGDQPGDVKELRHGRPLLVLLVDHQRRADPAVGVAATAHLAPLRLRTVHQIGEVSKRAHQ